MVEAPVNLVTVGETLLEVVAQVLLLLGYWLDWLFTEHLLLGNVLSAALLLGLADVAIQALEIFALGKQKVYEKIRTYRSMQVGIVLGVFNHLWYAFLESFLQGTGLSIVFKKIALDQAVAGPFFSSAFLIGMGLLEGKLLQEVYNEWSQKFVHIYMVDWMFWPMAQFINFHLVPYRFRVFYVNFATFLWNTFLCYAKHHSEEVLRKHQHAIHGCEPLGLTYNSSEQPEKERSNSETTSSRNHSRSPSKSRSSPLKIPLRKRGSLTSRKRKAKSGKVARHLTAAKQTSRPVRSTSSTIHSIVAIKKLLPVIGPSPNLSELKTDVRQLREDSWTTEDFTNCTASLNGSSSTSGSSINTRVGAPASTSTITKSALHVRDRSVSTRREKATTVRELGLFPHENQKKASCVQSVSTKRKIGIKTRQSQNLSRGMPRETKAPVKPDTSYLAGGEVSQRFWVPPGRPAVGTRITPRPVRGYPTTGPPATSTHDLEEVKAALKEVKNLVLKEHEQLRDQLANIQAQVTRLQELCAVTYVSVDDGTRDLAQKADQLASWVQKERKLEVNQIKTIMEEVLASTTR